LQKWIKVAFWIDAPLILYQIKTNIGDFYEGYAIQLIAHCTGISYPILILVYNFRLSGIMQFRILDHQKVNHPEFELFHLNTLGFVPHFKIPFSANISERIWILDMKLKYNKKCIVIQISS
jgi:hypothetical protein